MPPLNTFIHIKNIYVPIRSFSTVMEHFAITNGSILDVEDLIYVTLLMFLFFGPSIHDDSGIRLK